MVSHYSLLLLFLPGLGAWLHLERLGSHRPSTILCRNTDHGKDKVKAALKKSLKDLQLDFLDLYLVRFEPCLALPPRS